MSTENGANVGGDVDTGGGNFIGRDQFIQNITVIAQFLDYSGIQKILPISSGASDELKIIKDVVIKYISEQFPSDLSVSLAFAGYIILITGHFNR
jgi:hypothetical protein